MKFKIRCSSIGHIMTEAKGNITQNQLKEINTLETKEKLTEKQNTRLQELYYKQNNPQLSDTAKTYCKTWVKQKLYSRRKYISSKYMEKGLIMEDNSLDFIAEYLNLGMLIKNEEFKENDFMSGTCDAILPDMLIDVKNSWDCFTLPLFFDDEFNSLYYWQAQGYMHLYNRDKYKLIYVLSDTPEHLIKKDAYWYAKNNGYDELTQDLYDEFIKQMTYSNIPNNLKIRIFNIEKNNDDIEKVKIRVGECQKYINELINKLPNA